MNKKINKILIANRSEISSRIQFTCKKLNIKTLSIFSLEDQEMPYIYQSDENHILSLSGTKAYINQKEIIEIAKKTNCDAIHPGYGFLSENGTFAKKVIDANLIWIGPNHKIISLMANKIQSRKILAKINAPLIPGCYVNKNNQNEAKIFAKKIGYPILLKDPLGGGGKAIKKLILKKNLIIFST